MVEGLEPRLAYVVIARYGLKGHVPSLYRQIGTALGVTKQRAQQLHVEALARLGHSAHSYHLRDLLGRNATFQRWALKPLPVYGAPRGKACIFLSRRLVQPYHPGPALP